MSHRLPLCDSDGAVTRLKYHPGIRREFIAPLRVTSVLGERTLPYIVLFNHTAPFPCLILRGTPVIRIDPQDSAPINRRMSERSAAYRERMDG